MRLAFVVPALLATTASVGCFSLADDCDFNMNLPCFYENAGGGGTGGEIPLACIPSEENPDIDNSCGVFVSPNGSDVNGDGTKERPYLTLGKAMSEGDVVYACANATNPFDEAVEPAEDVTLYGGLDCANGWLYDPKKKSAWTAPADAVPLVVGGDVQVTVHDFALTARDATMPGGSSIAVLAFGQTAELVLERCEVTAGNGAAGVTPPKPEGSGPPGQPGENGQEGCVDLTGKLGGNGGQTMCEDISTNGGLGGTGTSTTTGGPGVDGEPVGTTGKGGKRQDDTSCGNGENGADGLPGTPGDGATGLGTLSEAGYTGVWGGDGKTKGSPGQGGGGGGGAKQCEKTEMGNPNNHFAGPGGGGGGSGGCGGEPGKGGGPGGSSIAVASVGAKLTLFQVTLTAKNGGAGGTGGDGQNGGLGGTSGQAGTNDMDTQAKACGGGEGGKGGDGGGGGGGLGGHSVGIAFTGAAPSSTAEVTITSGGAGPGGFGGNMSMEVGAKGGLGRTCKTLNFDDGTCSK